MMTVYWFDIDGTICTNTDGDYGHAVPFIRVSEEAGNKSIEILKYLIKQCAQIGIRGIEIPMVDNSRIETEKEEELFITSSSAKRICEKRTFRILRGVSNSR